MGPNHVCSLQSSETVLLNLVNAALPDEDLLNGGEYEGCQEEGEGQVQQKRRQMGLRAVLLSKGLHDKDLG